MRILRNYAFLERVLQKRRTRKKRITDKVSRILKSVKMNGDEALLEYTRKFDKVKLSLKSLRISETEISSSFNELNAKLVATLKIAIDNVFKFYRHQKYRPLNLKESNGKLLKVLYRPYQRIGVYVPGGSAPLVSSVYMSVIPALVAGVKEIVLVSPPTSNNTINSYILAVASLLKIKEIYKIGGAQAIAGLAFGTKTIRKVDKIIGPGNEFVTEAKRQVCGETAIDMLAGPSEVVIIAGKNANVEYIIADLEAQLEHRGGLGIVITNSKRVMTELCKVKTQGWVMRVRNFDQAVGLVNKIAPEHLEILTQKPSTLLNKIHHCGAVFLGEHSPVALGDYTAGPSHVLPTGGSARIYSSLSVRDFLRELHVINYTKKALLEEFEVLEKIAGLEGMVKHIESVKKRIS